MDHSEQVASGTVLLTVNQRLARNHAAQYERWQWEQGHLWWETPAILPLRAWLSSLHEQAIGSGASTLTLLPELLQQRAWRQCVEQDTGLELLDVDAAAAGAKRAWEIACVWQCHAIEGDYLPIDQFAWQRWATRYRRLLDAEGWVDTAMLADHLNALITQGALHELLPNAVILEGFLQLPPQLQKLIEAMRAAGINVSLTTASPDAHVHRICYTDDAREMLSIATQMRHVLEQNPQHNLGLVVPDLHNKRAAVLRAFDQVFFPTQSPRQIAESGRPYDLSIGLPLADTAVVQCGLSLLKLSIASVDSTELSALLLSPYLIAANSEARRREQMDRRLREERVRSLDLSGLLQHLYSGSRLAGALKRLLKTRTRKSATLSEWATRFSQWLSLFGWPGKGMESEEYQAVTVWMECLDNLQLLDDGSNVSANEALGVLRRLARDQVFQVESPRTPIQIMGRLESHAIPFDWLWLAGLDSEQWPAAGSPTPFLPMAQQKLAGVPDASAAARLALAELEFRQWSSQAPLLIVSHALNRDGKALDAARLPDITASSQNSMLAATRLDSLKLLNHHENPAVQICHGMPLESVADTHGPALPAGSDVRGGARLFENQALCPFRAFALHRLLIRPLEEAGLGLDPRQHGTLLHHVLELFWRSIKTQDAMLALTPEELDNTVLSVIDEAISENKVPDALADLERTRLGNLILEWLQQCEMRRPPFEVVSLEERQELEHGGINMNVMLDRIDRVDDRLVVIDYKTGTSNKVNTWADTRIVNPQLPLYVLTNDEIKGVSFAQVARNQCGFKGVASDDALIPKVKTTVQKSRSGQATDVELDSWEAWRTHWKSSLDAVAKEVREGLASVTPMDSACTYCELKPLCRVDESAVTDAGEPV